jgi:hypothetical protein
MAIGTPAKNDTQLYVCKKCKAPHYSHQLSCKRCGDYFAAEDLIVSSNTPMIFAGALGLMVAILAACTFFHVL